MEGNLEIRSTQNAPICNGDRLIKVSVPISELKIREGVVRKGPKPLGVAPKRCEIKRASR